MNVSTLFILNVDGTSWGQLIITTISPVISFLTTLYALYQLRALFLNRCCKQRYEKEAKEYAIGEEFSLELSAPRQKVRTVTLREPAERAWSKHCQFFNLPRSLPGDITMPSWLEYEPFKNCLRTRGPIPDIGEQNLVVQVSGKMGVILEQFELHILPARQPVLQGEASLDREILVSPTAMRSSVEQEIKEDKSEGFFPDDAQGMTRVDVEKLSIELQTYRRSSDLGSDSSDLEAPLQPSPRRGTRLPSGAEPTPRLGRDSPLRQAAAIKTNTPTQTPTGLTLG